ncbi:hypothetical protein ASPNIDRAFT_35423 [Aspergillus niger ATCC 1015]|uniref:Uncharacterized protein n=1 Tax=Aspergillus niger (strain ATCC 1015 / CBS 113.46 / FGSC A1144 / LSHB Ac4 / NCTC 3858a / NRRL 328 / USDA 3528.7) TaxID=380704 RepID=G3XS81_ASPNA|nr:hypothetical protein ASPNIDRAFT_35423 [Aspergillus niger ATCC 1015]
MADLDAQGNRRAREKKSMMVGGGGWNPSSEPSPTWGRNSPRANEDEGTGRPHGSITASGSAWAILGGTGFTSLRGGRPSSSSGLSRNNLEFIANPLLSNRWNQKLKRPSSSEEAMSSPLTLSPIPKN